MYEIQRIYDESFITKKRVKALIKKKLFGIALTKSTRSNRVGALITCKLKLLVRDCVSCKTRYAHKFTLKNHIKFFSITQCIAKLSARTSNLVRALNLAILQHSPTFNFERSIS